jgi:hypothetical protein
MKRIFTLLSITIIIIIFGFSGLKSQSFELVGGDTLLAGEVGDVLGTVGRVKNISSNAVKVKCSIKMMTIAAGHEFEVCWAGQCLAIYISTDFDFNEGIDLQPGESLDDLWGFHITMVDNGLKGLTRVKVIFYNQNNSADKYELITSFYVGVSSVDWIFAGLTLSEPVPNPAKDIISISYDIVYPTNVAKLKVYTSSGLLVNSNQINGTKGNFGLNVSSLPQGKYFYLLDVDGRKSKPVSFIVQR